MVKAPHPLLVTCTAFSCVNWNDLRVHHISKLSKLADLYNSPDWFLNLKYSLFIRKKKKKVRELIYVKNQVCLKKRPKERMVACSCGGTFQQLCEILCSSNKQVRGVSHSEKTTRLPLTSRLLNWPLLLLECKFPAQYDKKTQLCSKHYFSRSLVLLHWVTTSQIK